MSRSSPLPGTGLRPNPTARPTLDDLAQALADLTPAEAPVAPPSLPPADYWDEDTVVAFQQSRYKIVGRLGRGGIGQTFKVVEFDPHSDEKFGTYVAKLVRDAAGGEAAILAYKRVRASTTHPNLSTIHAFAPAWEPDRFVALMKWVEGQPLHDLTGVLDLYAEDLGEASAEALAQRWLLDLRAALGELHRVGLVHCLTDREPLTHGTERRKDRGLNWDGIKGWHQGLPDTAPLPRPGQPSGPRPALRRCPGRPTLLCGRAPRDQRAEYLEMRRT